MSGEKSEASQLPQGLFEVEGHSYVDDENAQEWSEAVADKVQQFLDAASSEAEWKMRLQMIEDKLPLPGLYAYDDSGTDQEIMKTLVIELLKRKSFQQK